LARSALSKLGAVEFSLMAGVVIEYVSVAVVIYALRNKVKGWDKEVVKVILLLDMVFSLKDSKWFVTVALSLKGKEEVKLSNGTMV